MTGTLLVERRARKHGTLNVGDFRATGLAVVNPDIPLARSRAFAHWVSCTQRKPRVPERSMLGAIISSLPCWFSLYACGKYQIDPCG